MTNGDLLYKALGVKAETVIDHAWGWEPIEIPAIKAYRPASNSISSGQVLKEPYDSTLARLIIREMAELLALDLVRKRVVTKKITLTIGYDRTSLSPANPKKAEYTVNDKFFIAGSEKMYTGKLAKDHYGRIIPYHAHGTGNLETWTSSTHDICDCMMQLYDRIINSDLLIRRVNICACNIISEDNIPEDTAPVQLELFVDYEALERENAEKKKKADKEKALQRATLALQSKYGKNAVLKGMNLIAGATTVERNGQIGGHRSRSE